jgi:hypothetical protein
MKRIGTMSLNRANPINAEPLEEEEEDEIPFDEDEDEDT